MSTIPKEIQDKINEAADKYGFVVPFNGSNKFYNDNLVDGFLDGAKYGYQLATDGREELEKETLQNCEVHQVHIGGVVYEMLKKWQVEKAVTALQSQCTEKDQEIERQTNFKTEYKEMYQNAAKIIEELKAENERLKEQYSIMDGRRERAIKSLEESEKQFEQLQGAYNKLIGG